MQAVKVWITCIRVQPVVLSPYERESNDLLYAIVITVLGLLAMLLLGGGGPSDPSDVLYR